MRYFKCTPSRGQIIYAISIFAGFQAASFQVYAQESIVPADAARQSVIASYEPAYFSVYNPQTALDMVVQIPGFSISFADEKRGLGEGGANVLINGRRLTGKTDPERQLARISAKNITRINIVDGASLSIAGLSGQVANIQTTISGQTGNWKWSPSFRRGIEPDWFNGEISYGGTIGRLDYNVKLQNNSSRTWSSGPENLVSADGNLYETRSEDAAEAYNRPGVSLDAKFEPRPDHIFNLNLDYEGLEFVGKFVSQQSAVASRGNDQVEVLDVVGKQWATTVGLDYERPLGTATLKFIGYHAFQDQKPVRQFDVINDNGFVRRTKFPQVSQKSEVILRSEYALPQSDTQNWQAAIETARNGLSVENQFLATGLNGALIGGPINQFDVNEDRLEGSLTHSRQISPVWDVQISVGAEYSELKQSSQLNDDETKRSFFRPKGFFAASYKYSPTLDIRTRVERHVGQLNFFDFVSSKNLQDDLDVTANPELVPEQSWLANIEFDKDLGHGSRFTANIYGASITDIIDRVPIGAQGEGVGNLDQAYRYGVDLSATVKGERWGWDGTQLDTRLQFRHSTLNDPLGDFKRRINSDKKAFYSVSFRHDIPNADWAYGASAERFYRAPEYRAFSSSQTDFDRAYVIAFLEHKNVAGLRVRAEVSNLTNRVSELERTFFVGRRDKGIIDHVESRQRKHDPFVNIVLSGQF